MNLKAEWVMMMQSHCAVAARARNRWRLSFTKFVSSATKDSGGRVELQELAARLGEAMTGHDHHRLGDETETLLLHDRGREAEGFTCSDRVSDIGRAGSDDPPDRPLLVGIEADDAGGAGNGQM